VRWKITPWKPRQSQRYTENYKFIHIYSLNAITKEHTKCRSIATGNQRSTTGKCQQHVRNGYRQPARVPTALSTDTSATIIRTTIQSVYICQLTSKLYLFDSVMDLSITNGNPNSIASIFLNLLLGMCRIDF